MTRTNQKSLYFMFALFVVVFLAALFADQVVHLVHQSRRNQNQAYLDKLQLRVGKVTFRDGLITGLSFSDLDGGKMADADLPKIIGFENLEVLDLRRCPITDSGLSQLSALKNLQSLGLEATQVSDIGLRHLSTLLNLRYLNLQLTDVTDSELEELQKLEGLQTLVITGTDVTQDGVNNLQRALPNCKILSSL